MRERKLFGKILDSLSNSKHHGAAITGRGAHGWGRETRRYDGKGFPGGSVVKNLPANVGDLGLILAGKDSFCHGATKPLATTTEPRLSSPWLRLLGPARPRGSALKLDEPPQ